MSTEGGIMSRHKTVSSFSNSIGDFIKEVVPDAIDKDIRKVTMAAYGGLINQSPVKDGYFRANWYPLVNEVSDFFNKNKQKQDSFDMPKYKIGDLITISNAAPYANRLEGGWSKQAKQGIVAPTKRALHAKIENGALL